jgi:hypothetical protein
MPSDAAIFDVQVADGTVAPDVARDSAVPPILDTRGPDGTAKDVPDDVTLNLDTVIVDSLSPDASSPDSSCLTYTPKAPPNAIAKTPRQNEAAEVLALEASGEFVAPDALYERVVLELDAILKVDPSVAGLKPLSLQTRANYIVMFDDIGWSAYKSGTYHAWDCANLAYGTTGTELVSDSLKIITLKFGDKRFNQSLFVKEYSAMPNIREVTSNQSGDGPDVCLEVQGDLDFYIYDRASGDCLAGCTEHQYTAFSVAPGAVVTKLGTFEPGVGSSLPEPAWYSQLLACRKYL